MLTHAVELRARGNQVRAEALLHHKQTQVKVPIQEPIMYLPKEEYEYLDDHHLPPNVELERETVTISPTSDQYVPSVTKRKKQPKYLTEEGILVSVEASEHCWTNKQETPKSAFLTDQDQEAEREWREDAIVNAKPKSRWQPLSSSAAQEYKGTHVVPLKTFSSQGHGKYSLWKPMLSYYSSWNSSPDNE